MIHGEATNRALAVATAVEAYTDASRRLREAEGKLDSYREIIREVAGCCDNVWTVNEHGVWSPGEGLYTNSWPSRDDIVAALQAAEESRQQIKDASEDMRRLGVWVPEEWRRANR